ncbi:7-cyano-7-deazaguanine synthase [Megasphaera vaginalis (ex Srinivasan et al. 2021)]|uniref:7-cyano-7-deazaguanine synthase n=1 Tax=Megasphaera vaginalis (ex Srinivasan et al. 2021) TaxID=1111454 RepID=U7UT15_9FIRM|nr:7-cyano-7-deazaguanine synthase [Megasphaera vaginalis (ex Srinivasan et al. 2021)]ERT62577.1 queuosine biosynthesis protein QueC [Megasphaera vaginalis (ex Srinivasan et al. 2021)]
MKALVLSSGGIDSTTALAMAVAEHGSDNVITLSIYYGQKHRKELTAAASIADYYRVRHLEINLDAVFQYSNCALLQQSTEAVPQATYAEQIAATGGEKPVATYVPFRNGLFLSAAAGVALSEGCDLLYYGVHAEDAAGFAYPDCSPAFQAGISAAIWAGSGHQLRVVAPFLHWYKRDIIRQGLALNVPYERTWSCYAGGEVPCGVCGTCRERAAAFAANGAVDPAVERRTP